MKRILFVFLLCIVPLTAKASSESIVKSLTDEVISKVVMYGKENVEDAEREKTMVDIIYKYFDVETMSNYVLRADVAECTNEELLQFRKIFVLAMAKKLVYRFKVYSGYKFSVVETNVSPKGGDDLVVTTFDIEDSYSKTEFVWRLNKQGKVIDIISESVSLIKNYRAEFSEFLKRNNKNVRRLTFKLNKYVKTPREKPFKML